MLLDPSGHKISTAISPKNLKNNGGSKKSGSAKNVKKISNTTGKTKTTKTIVSPIRKTISNTKSSQKAKALPTNTGKNPSSGKKYPRRQVQRVIMVYQERGILQER